MLTVEYSKMFKKDYKRAVKRGYNIKLIDEVITMLARGEKLPRKYMDHALEGKYKRSRECHITPDWLLVYEIYENRLILHLSRTGKHSELFGM